MAANSHRTNARVPRVDDVGHPELLGGPKRGAGVGEPLLDLGAERVGVVARLELGAVGGVDPTGERHGAPLGRRPRVQRREQVGIHLGRRAEPEEPAQHHDALRDRRLVDGGQRLRREPHRAGGLGAGADHQPGNVVEAHTGEVEGVGHVDEATELLAGGRVEPAPVVLGIGRHDGDRPAAQAGQAGDDRPPEQPRDLEEGALVHDGFYDPARLEHLAGRARDGIGEPVVTPVHRVGALQHGRQLEHRAGEVAEKSADPLEGILLVVGLVGDDTVAGVHGAASELLLRHVFAGVTHEGRTGGKDLRGPPDHHRVVALARLQRTQTGHGSTDHRHHRDGAERGDRVLQSRRIGGAVV